MGPILFKKGFRKDKSDYEKIGRKTINKSGVLPQLIFKGDRG